MDWVLPNISNMKIMKHWTKCVFCARTELSSLDNKFLHFISKNSLQPCIWRHNNMMQWSKLPRVDPQDFIIISKFVLWMLVFNFLGCASIDQPKNGTTPVSKTKKFEWERISQTECLYGVQIWPWFEQKAHTHLKDYHNNFTIKKT